MKGKVSFVGADAPKTVLEFEVPERDVPKAPPGYKYQAVHGSTELLRAQMDGGSLIIRWAWDPKPKADAGAGFACEICGKVVPTRLGLRTHKGIKHGPGT